MRVKILSSLLAGTALFAGVAIAAAQEHGRHGGGGGAAMHQAPSGGGWGGHGGFNHGSGMSMQGRAGGQIGGFNQPRSFNQGTFQGQHRPGFAQQNGTRGEHFGNRSYYGFRSGALNENRDRSFGYEHGYNRQTFSDQHRFAGHDFRGT